MIVLVTGADGVLGSRVCVRLAERSHTVRAACPSDTAVPVAVTKVDCDLETGRGVADAVDGVDAVVHCATDRRRHRRVDRAGTRNLVEAAAQVGRPHIVYPGLVGADLVPDPYFRSRQAAEETVISSGLGWSVLRSTEFHQTLWESMARRARWPVMVVPAGMRHQPIDPDAVARRLVDLVEGGPAGRLPDIGGPRAYEATALAGSYLAATGLRRLVVAVNRPGIAGAALRAGANLAVGRVTDGAGWNEFVAEMMEAA